VGDGMVLQRIWVRTHNDSGEAQSVALVVSPYFLSDVALYQPRGARWQALARGGAQHDGRLTTARLGAHQFDLTVAPGVSSWLLTVRAPPFAHRWLDLVPVDAGLSVRELVLAAHLGVLLTLTLVMLVAWALRPTALQAGGMGLAVMSLLSVWLGSGAMDLFGPMDWPFARDMLLLQVLVAVRLLAQNWIFQRLIAPDVSLPRVYRRLNGGVYAVLAVSVLAFLLDRETLGWPLVLLAIYVSLAVQAWALLKAPAMAPMLRRALAGAVLFFLALNLSAVSFVLWSSGQSSWPLHLTRFSDVAIPITMMVVILVRNAVVARELGRVKSDLLRRDAALAMETKLRDDKRVLLDMLTHEIKNPLASISFAARTLAQSTRAEQASLRRIANIERSVADIDQIVDRARLSESVEDGRIQVANKPFALPAWLAARLSATPRLRLVLPDRLNVSTDDYLLGVVVDNLVDNALKYSPPDSEVVLKLIDETAARGGWRLQVINQANAVMPLDPDRVFERFYRHDQAQGVRGTGLGLTLTRDLCTLLGAEVRCAQVGDEVKFEVIVEVKRDG
jgi:signal transduction histidine kinase